MGTVDHDPIPSVVGYGWKVHTACRGPSVSLPWAASTGHVVAGGTGVRYLFESLLSSPLKGSLLGSGVKNMVILDLAFFFFFFF